MSNLTLLQGEPIAFERAGLTMDATINSVGGSIEQNVSVSIQEPRPADLDRVMENFWKFARLGDS